MRAFTFLLAAAASVAAWAGGEDGELVERTSGPWHLSVGPVLSPRVRVRVHGPRPVLPPPRPRTASSGTEGSVAADPSAGSVGRQYADGYVNPDEGTADPNSMIAGLTWNWGASDVGAQYVGGRMEFRTEMAGWRESVSSSSYGSGAAASGSDRDALLGVEAKGGLTFFESRMFDAAVDAGFRFYGSGDLNASSKYGTSVTTTRTPYRYVDSYGAGGWTDTPKGPHAGSAGGPGRLLEATPTRREEPMGATRSTETYVHHASTKLDYDIWDLRLGPTLGWKVADRLTLRGGVYGLLGLVDARLESSVESSNGSKDAKKSVCAGVFGMAAGLSAQFDITDDVYLVGGAEYDWWGDAVHMKAGGADARVKLSDFTVSLALGVAF